MKLKVGVLFLFLLMFSFGMVSASGCTINGVCSEDDNAFTCSDCYCGEKGYSENYGQSYRGILSESGVKISASLMGSLNSYEIKKTILDDNVAISVNGEEMEISELNPSGIVGGLNVTILNREGAFEFCVYEPESTKEAVYCTGCFLEGKCIPSGTRLNVEEVASYCSSNEMIEAQKDFWSECSSDYECVSNLCVEGECVDQTFLRKVIEWFKRTFGGQFS